MAMVKAVLAWFAVGALLGLVAASLAAPSTLSWYNSPGMGSALCECSKTTRDVASGLLTLQAVGAGIGGVGAAVLGVMWEMRKKKKTAAAAPA